MILEGKRIGNVLRIGGKDIDIIDNPLGEEYRYKNKALIYHMLLDEYEVVKDGIIVYAGKDKEKAINLFLR